MARKLFWPLVSSYNFTQWGWRIPFGLGDFPGHIEFCESPPNYLFLGISRVWRMCFCPRSYVSSYITPWEEPSNSWTFESTLLDLRISSWIWIRRINFAFTIQLLHSLTTFNETMITSLLQQTRPRIYGGIFHSCSKTSNSIFTLAVATHIPLRHLTPLFFLN